MTNDTDTTANQQGWLLMVHLLPPKPTNLRVRTWRKLQRLGAVAIKNSVYVLPFNDRTNEDFQWLKQEIESAGGEATVFRATAVEGTTDKEIVAAFAGARNEEYAVLTAELDGLSAAVTSEKRKGRLPGRGAASVEADLDKLHKELERIIAIDFFGTTGRSAALKAHERGRKAVLMSRNRQSPLPAAASLSKKGIADPAQFQRRRWVTRRNLFIDRLASIWLIKRFIDKRPRFLFVSEGETVEDGVAFDMYGADFTHRGEDCTFETMLKCFGLDDDPGLRAIGEIIHDIDLKDDKFNRLEASGLNAVVSGLAELLKDDRKLVANCDPIFDGLYELLGGDEIKLEKEASGKQAPKLDAPRRRTKRK
jgi:hypothetical protein